MSNIQGALTGLAGAVGGATGLAVKGAKGKIEGIKDTASETFDTNYATSGVDLLTDVTKTTRKKDRNVLLQNYGKANEIASNYQQAITVQKKAFVDRLTRLGGVGTKKGKEFISQFNANVQETRAGARKELTKLRKEDKGGKK